jgi:hypothetical protein
VSLERLAGRQHNNTHACAEVVLAVSLLKASLQRNELKTLHFDYNILSFRLQSVNFVRKI